MSTETSFRELADQAYEKGMKKLEEARQTLHDAVVKTVTPNLDFTKGVMGILMEAQVEFAAQEAYEHALIDQERREAS
jgi:hypothetical protein